MTDNNDNSQGISKADLIALLDDRDLKAAAREADLKATFAKELDVQANKIHSSYAKKLKNSSKAETATDDEVEEDAPNRRPTKRELEMQANIEKMVKRTEDAEKKARLSTLRASVTDNLVKNGIHPDAVDQVFKVLNANSAFQDDGEELGFKLKVDVDGVSVALPIETAVKHYVKSPEAKFYLAPKNIAGSGATQTNKSVAVTDGKAKPRVEIDWGAVASDLVQNSQ